MQLVTMLVLVYPAFTKEFGLETDVSIQGLGAILFKNRVMGSYTRSLHQQSIESTGKELLNQLETLAVVWGISHFHHYVYGTVLWCTQTTLQYRQS